MLRGKVATRAFEAIHALPEAKMFRAVMLHYAACRRKHGRGHQFTRDAEENCYQQMFALHPRASVVLTALMEAEEE